MKISLNWLGLFVDVPAIRSQHGLRDLTDAYSASTANITQCVPSDTFEQVVVGKVLTAERHPESSKLWICQVDVGGGERIVRSGLHGNYHCKPDGSVVDTEQILTWAPNVYPGMFTPVAVVGCRLSPDFVIGERKMAGMISRGMMCGADEIWLSNTSSGGIMDLNAEYDVWYLDSVVGKPFFTLTVPVLGANGETVQIPLDDTVIEIGNDDISHRPDLFWIYGHSREFSTVFGVSRNRIETEIITPFSDDSKARVEVQTDKVLSYCLAKFENVSDRPSPLGVEILLARSWHSSHGAIVDMTNYLMMELGQPMHAFDADTIEGHIIVRQAVAGESVTALDGKTYVLVPEDIVIADTVKILAIAGVMGGLHTGISETTKNICVESAVFDAASVRNTAKRLGLPSDASMRFEKSLDPTFSPIALRRAVQFLEFAKVGGTLVGYSEYLNESKLRQITLAFTHRTIKKAIGMQISENEILKTLSDLEFAPAMVHGVYDLLYPSNKSLGNHDINPNVEAIYEVLVPSHRATKDIGTADDIVEEIARIHWYDHIIETPISWVHWIVPKNDAISLRNALQNFLVGDGFSEVKNSPFENVERELTDNEAKVVIARSETQEPVVLRSSLAPSLFRNARENLKRVPSVKFFEISKVFQKVDERVVESWKLAEILSNGNVTDIRSSLDGLFSKLNAEVAIHQGSDLPFLHPNASGNFSHGTGILASFGSLHPNALRDFELPGTSWYFEIDLSELAAAVSTAQNYIAPSAFPGVSRELNFLLDRTSGTGEVAKLISSVDSRIRSLSVADVYEHDKIGKDKKSVTFSFVMEDAAKPMTDEECQVLQNTIVETLEAQSIYLRR